MVGWRVCPLGTQKLKPKPHNMDQCGGSGKGSWRVIEVGVGTGGDREGAL